jgi:hypothetical protein
MDDRRKGKYPETSFDFLGYTFRTRKVKSHKHNKVFVGFTPAVSNAGAASRSPRIPVVEPLGFTGTAEPKKGAIARQQPWRRSQGIARRPKSTAPAAAARGSAALRCVVHMSASELPEVSQRSRARDCRGCHRSVDGKGG